MGARVALESTLVAHGLPWPDNLTVARELEQTVRARGAEPATIAIVDGEVKLGLSPGELERLARDGKQFAKAGKTDIAVHLARKTCAATTVSATAAIAADAGIDVFSTGGIGGVHRGDANDVSHDLVALSCTQLAVVSAGAKAILDLPRTLEMLETLGVLVIGFRTRQFPAFYTRSSGLALEHSVDSIDELAAIARRHWLINHSAVLVANPIPEAAELTGLEPAIERALADALTAGITGKPLTPFLLARLAEVTGGRSIHANRALALHNADVGAQLALALAAED